MDERSVKPELSEDEMLEVGFEKVGRLYVQYDDPLIVWAPVLANGNAPVGGQFYEVAELAK